MKKVVVTGGAGFIGSHLCEKLAGLPGYAVWSLDNYSSGSTDNHVEGVTYLNGDTRDIDQRIDFTPDLVFHLGEYSRTEQSFADVEKVLQFNQSGTQAVIEFCRQRGCKLVYAGSSTKFADAGSGPEQSPYAWTKAANTQLIQLYGKWYGLSYAIAYFYNAYGPREISSGPYATLIGLFTRHMRDGSELQVVHPGAQVRNFTHVRDIVEGVYLVGEHGQGDGYAVGSEESYSVLDIARMFGGPIKMLTPRPGNRMHASLNSEKTQALGWAPQYSVSQYIKQLRANDWRQQADAETPLDLTPQ